MSGPVTASAATPTGTQVALHWSLRSTFTEYVRSIDDGRVTTADVDIDSAGRFVFAGTTDDADGDDPVTTLAFGGTVDFWAHFGVLNFHLTDLRLQLDTEPRLSIGAQPRERQRATIALLTEVDPTPGSGALRAFQAALTDDGVRLLGGVYSVGAPLDLLTLMPTQTGAALSPPDRG